MAELTREQIVDWRYRLHTILAPSIPDVATRHEYLAMVSELCDLALRALEQTNAAGGSESHHSGASSIFEAGASAPAAPTSKPTVVWAEIVWGQPQLLPDGTWYRAGTSTGATMPEQPESPPTQELPAVNSASQSGTPASSEPGTVGRSDSRMLKAANPVCDSAQQPALGGVSNAELEWPHRFLNCTVFGPPPSEIQRAHHIVEQLASAIVTLRQERDAYKQSAQRRGKSIMPEVLELRQRAEAAERNAARYRWLRDASVTNGAIDPDDDDFWNDLGDLLGEKFDAAIDAAMKAKL